MPDGAASEGGDSSSVPGDHMLGAHLDRLLRAAEHEATEIREVAERRAAALLTEAHAEIARHEQDRRRAWQEREVALLAAEQRSADELAAARDQAAQLVTAADQEAQGILGRARRRAEEISVAAAKTIDRGRRDAAQELERLVELRDAARAEVQRLLRSLDGLREALTYELDAAIRGVSAREQAQEPRTATEAPAGPPPASAAATAIGRRRGDLHRARYSGLAVGDPDRTDGCPGPTPV
jgi:hypothetical protein